MIVFERKLWRARALKRYQRSLIAGAAREKAVISLKTDLININNLSRLISWCSTKKIHVSFSRREGGIYHPDDRAIIINGRAAPEKQVFLLLHECGHHLIGDKRKHERFGMGYSSVDNDPYVTRTLQHRIDIIDEELEAWHRGFRLGQRAELCINKQNYDRFKSVMLKSYLLWATERHR